MEKLFYDLKTDEEKSDFFLTGRGYETGVIAQAIQNDVAMAYHRCAEYKKELEALKSQTIHADDWFDTFMELARAVVVENRLFAVCPTTTKQKAAAEATIALQEHARKRPVLQSQDREDAERLDWLEDQAQTSRTGVSIDYVYDAQYGYMNEKGYRFMRHRFIGPLGKTVREAIDHARRVEGEEE